MLNLIVIGGDLPENWALRVPPINVTQGHRDRHRSTATYDLLLVIKSKNHGLIFTVSEIKADFGRKTIIYPTQRI